MTTPIHMVSVPVDVLRELIDASSEVRDLLANVPEMQDRKYVGTGNRFVNAIGAAQRSYLSAAPDALRIAVEALEKTRGRIQMWPIDDHETCMCGSPVSSHDIGSGHSPVSQADHAVSTIVEEINKALAALQAEQGAK